MPIRLLLAFGIASSAATPLVAADKQSERETPIFVANLAGADRLLEDSDRLFGLLQRADLALGFKAALALSTNGLKGVDRKRPLGLMTVIDSGEAPEPVAVVYLPITTAKEFLASLRAIKVGVAPVRNGYALTWNGDRYALRIHRRYAFFARRMKSLQRNFGDPAVDFAPLSKAYDASIKVQLDAVPEGMKWMILDYARAVGATAFQRRPGELAADHRVRKSVGTLVLAGMTELLRDGRAVTIGVSLKKSPAPALLEVRMSAKKNSALSRGLARLSPKAADGRLNGAASGAVVNWKPPATLRPVVDALLGTPGIANDKTPDGLARVWTSLRAGCFDNGICVAVRPSAKSPVVVVRIGLGPTRKNSEQLRSLLVELQRDGAIASLKPNAVRERRIAFHRFECKGPAGLTALTGAGGDAVWLAVGTNTRDVEKALKATQLRRNNARKPPGAADELFGLSIRWLALRAALANDRKFWSALQPASGTDKPAADRLHLTVTRRGDDLVFRARLEEGLLRLLGKSIAGQFEGKKAP